ncbi:MAG: macro domain-containing protein [Chitinophagaceae bacterium]|nr:macro domain-containing protein [Chitinophagaceae bacterium]
MISYVKGNMLASSAEALVNTVNTEGVMGKGIALQFKNKFPSNFREYEAACKSGWLQPGKLLVVKDGTLENEKLIINFPTKTKWYLKSRYEYIESGLEALVAEIRSRGIKSIAIPPLGCGHGGLKWEKVKPIMEKHLAGLEETEIIIYEPGDEVKAILKKEESKKDVELTTAKAMVLYSLYYYESLGEESSLFVANKLAYFLKRLGEPSLKRLKFEASHYGPYSVQLGHMMHALTGRYLRGLEQMDAKPFEMLELNYDTFEEVRNYVHKVLSAEERQRIKNLVTLIDGFQTSLSLETLATVDFVKHEYKAKTQSEVIDKIHNWSDRKRKLMTDKYISIAYNQLDEYSGRLEMG